ncbi:MAG: RidA family protein [Bacillota bacterium]
MKEVIETGLTTTAPLSQAVRAGDLVFVSGQVPVDPATNSLVKDGVEKQTEVVLERIKLILQAAGCSLTDVVKVTVFLTDIGNFAAMNRVYQRYFPVNPPARSCVEAKLAIDAALEIEAIAYMPLKK